MKNQSAKDPVISREIHYVLFGWPTEKTLRLASDHSKNCKVELSIDQCCFIMRICVIIPKTLESNVLESLHEANPGISRMKSLASLYLWWVKMDEGIEKRDKTSEFSKILIPTSAPVYP